MPLRSHRIRRKRGWGERGGRRSITTGGSVELLFPWKWQAAVRGHYQFKGIDCRSLAIFNLNRWIGCHACRGIDKAAAFSELQLMSLSFGGRPGYSPLPNDSPRPHLSAYWSRPSAFGSNEGEEKIVICVLHQEYLSQSGRSWMFTLDSQTCRHRCTHQLLLSNRHWSREPAARREPVSLMCAALTQLFHKTTAKKSKKKKIILKTFDCTSD